MESPAGCRDQTRRCYVNVDVSLAAHDDADAPPSPVPAIAHLDKPHSLYSYPSRSLLHLPRDHVHSRAVQHQEPDHQADMQVCLGKLPGPVTDMAQ